MHKKDESILKLKVRELSREEIAAIAREARRIRQKIQEQIDRTNHITSDTLDFMSD